MNQRRNNLCTGLLTNSWLPWIDLFLKDPKILLLWQGPGKRCRPLSRATPGLEMPFQFINNKYIDRSTRRLIRSHAAKGKNLGKTLPKRRTRVQDPAPVSTVKEAGFISASHRGLQK